MLVADVSASIDDIDFDLQKRGYALALADPRVLAAMRGGRVALHYLEFSSADEARTVVDWTLIDDAAAAAAFAARVQAAPRSFAGRTSISAGVALATAVLAESGLDARRRVIDVSGDGTNNHGREVTEARDQAVAAGITINGLAIINQRPRPWSAGEPNIRGGLDGYYRENVAGGPGAFVLVVHDFASFGEALARKLITEIAGLPAATGRQG